MPVCRDWVLFSPGRVAGKVTAVRLLDNGAQQCSVSFSAEWPAAKLTTGQ